MEAVAARFGAFGAVRSMAMAGAAGALLALAQPPLSWSWAVFLAAPPLLWLLDAATGAGQGFRIGWAAGAGFFAAGLFWIVEPFMVDATRHGWIAPFALILMSGGLALFWGAAFCLARIAWPPGPLRALTLAAAWTFADIVRSQILTGFPWALQAYAWIETPVAQALAWIGPHGLSFLTLAAALLPATIERGRYWPVAAAAAVVALGWGAGELRLGTPAPERAEPLVVRLVQPNAEQRLKWRPDMQQEFFQRHLELTRAPASPPPDVVIWSETAVPFVLGYADDLQAEVAQAAPDATVILGIERLEATERSERWFNSLAALGPDGQPLAVYDKAHLVPFGEYIPFGSELARLGPRVATMTARGFTPGDGPHLLFAPGLPPFLPLICYEAIFPDRMQASEGRADWMVQVTNDGWFGTLAGPYQHFAQARARAIEQGLPLARSANTGISAMVDPYGRVVASLPLGAIGHLDAVLPGPLPETAYAKRGEWPTLAVLAVIAALTASSFISGFYLRRWR